MAYEEFDELDISIMEPGEDEGVGDGEEVEEGEEGETKEGEEADDDLDIETEEE